MVRNKLKKAARCNIRNNIPTLFFVNFLVWVSMGFYTSWYNLDLKNFRFNHYFTGVSIGLACVLIYPALQIGQKKTYLKNSQGEKASLKYLMTGFSNYGRSILLYILTSVFTLLWSFLFIIPGIIKSYSYSMSPYILAENPDISAREAIKISKRMMYGHKWDLFKLYLSFFWWILLCILTLGVAAIYVGPYMEATFANFYNELKNN